MGIQRGGYADLYFKASVILNVFNLRNFKLVCVMFSENFKPQLEAVNTSVAIKGNKVKKYTG